VAGILASIVDGLLVGAVYGLAAMGITLIWGVMNVVNLTHGALIVAGMFALYISTSALGVPPYLALPPIFVVGFLAGLLLYWIAVHRRSAGRRS
jgi:branched-chain amino acid transport system permease protein